MRLALLLLATCLAITLLSAAERADLPSPDGSLILSVSLKNEQLGYSLMRGEIPLLDWAPLGITINNIDSGAGLKSIEPLGNSGELSKTFPVSGVHAEGKVFYIEYRIGGLKNGQTLRFRIFNDGAAFRYEFPEGTTGKVDSESTAFGVRDNAVLWTQDGGAALGPCEGAWYPAHVADFFVSPDIGNADTKELRKFVRTGPILASLPNNQYLLIQEAGSFGLGWSGLKYAVNNGTPVRAFYYHDRKGFPFPEKTTATPWRVVLAARSLNALVNSDIVGSLVPRPDPVLFPEGLATPWCKPGRATWTWLAKNSAKYNDQLDFVDLAAELGFEYHLVDDGWEKWKSDENLSPWELLTKVVERGRQKNVKIWVWKRWNDIGKPENNWAKLREFLDKVKAVGVVGLKIDFMDQDSQERIRFYDATLRFAAERQLMINFHGANTPSGERTSWPNEMIREGVMGLEYFPSSIQHYCALPFTRYVAGPGDFTPFYPSNNQGRLTGTSWAMQLACAVIYTSPVQNYAFGPNEINEAAPQGSLQRAILKNLPAVWDETIVLPGAEIGKLAPFARRKGDIWYVGIINGETHRKGSLKLGFLAAGKSYRAELISDDVEKNNAWEAAETTVSSYSILPIIMRAKGGFVARFIPIEDEKDAR